MKIFIVFMFNIYSLILLTFIDNNLQSKNCTHKDYKSKTQGRGVKLTPCRPGLNLDRIISRYHGTPSPSPYCNTSSSLLYFLILFHSPVL